ncbi:hypothetical protein DSECCO2_37550 [anaerobic digester metagenome]
MSAGWRTGRNREIDHFCPDRYRCIMTRPAGPGKEGYRAVVRGAGDNRHPGFPNSREPQVILCGRSGERNGGGMTGPGE